MKPAKGRSISKIRFTAIEQKAIKPTPVNFASNRMGPPQRTMNERQAVVSSNLLNINSVRSRPDVKRGLVWTAARWFAIRGIEV